MKIGDIVIISDFNFYDCDGEIIGETPKYWKVKLFNHRTMGELWKEQEKKIKLFNKKSLFERGFYKNRNNGCFTKIYKVNSIEK